MNSDTPEPGDIRDMYFGLLDQHRKLERERDAQADQEIRDTAQFLLEARKELSTTASTLNTNDR